MKSQRLYLTLAYAFVLGFTLRALAISPELAATVHYETKSNAVSERSEKKIELQNYEIPYSLVAHDVAERIDSDILNSLVFEKNGEKYIRWVINPEDTKWHLEVEKFLSENGVSTEKHTHFEGYQTASRSYIVVDPETQAEFSLKVSTDKTGGAWTDKKQTYEDAWQIRMVTDYVQDMIKRTGRMDNVILLDEPAIFGLAAIDQGMVVRDYGKIAGTGHTYVPGFSIMHDETGKRLAKLNGSNDPAAFWNEHYNKPLARAIAEFAAMTGMTYDSPHSQNFLVELDAKNHPTGKIVFRDFGDTYLSGDFFKALGRADILKKWEQPNVVKDVLNISVGILHGNKDPSWMNTTQDTPDNSSYDQWGRDFFKTFKEEFYRQTGIHLPPQSRRVRQMKYIHQSFLLKNSPEGLKFLTLVKEGKQRDSFRYGQCRSLFLNH